MRPNANESQMIICADQESLHVLRQSNHVVGDGNFKYQPLGYRQFYTIHAFSNGECFPVIYALLPNKEEQTYRYSLI